MEYELPAQRASSAAELGAASATAHTPGAASAKPAAAFSSPFVDLPRAFTMPMMVSQYAGARLRCGAAGWEVGVASFNSLGPKMKPCLVLPDLLLLQPFTSPPFSILNPPTQPPPIRATRSWPASACVRRAQTRPPAAASPPGGPACWLPPSGRAPPPPSSCRCSRRRAPARHCRHWAPSVAAVAVRRRRRRRLVAMPLGALQRVEEEEQGEARCSRRGRSWWHRCRCSCIRGRLRPRCSRR